MKPIRALVTGATGFLGNRLLDHLKDPVVLTRNPVRARSRLGSVETFAWNPLDEPAPARAFEGVDAVFNLLGEPISGRWTDAKKEAIRESRVQGTSHLVAGMGAADTPPSVLVSVSAVGYYGDRGEEDLTEASGPGEGFLAGVCTAWEAAAYRAEELGVRVVTPRIGLVLGREGGALAALRPIYRSGLGGPLGSGRQYWPWVHVEDVIGLLLWVARTPSLSGAVNVAGPEPATNREISRALGRALRRPAVLPVPGFALRLVVGEFAGDLLASQKVVPAAALDHGFAFRFADHRVAVAEAI